MKEHDRLDIDRIAFIGRTYDEYVMILIAFSISLTTSRICIHGSLKELVRVSSGEVRIFPLQGLDARPYPQMDAVLSFLASERINAEIVEVPFEFQKGSNKMLKLCRMR